MRPSAWDPGTWAARPGWVVRELRALVPFGLPYAGYQRRWLASVRSALVERDGSRCAGCGMGVDASEWWFPFDVDHVVALVDDGPHALANMQLLCRGCHARKTGGETTARASKPAQTALPASRPITLTENTDIAISPFLVNSVGVDGRTGGP